MQKDYRADLKALLTEEPITAPVLCEALGIDAPRLRATVRALVLDGVPVVTAGNRGYRLATTSDDVRHEVAQLRSRAMKIIKRAAILERVAAPTFAGQLALDLAQEEAA